MRRAVAEGIDRKAYNDLTTNGDGVIADQPFHEGDMGYVADNGFPEFDAADATKLVAEYVADGNSAEVTLNVVSDPAALARSEIIQNQLKKVGISVKIHSGDTTNTISESVAGAYQMVLWRQHGGGDVDSQYIWWHSAPNPTNLARINDPLIDKALEEGRAEPDQAKRRELYKVISTEFGAKVWNVWLSYAVLAVGMSPNVHGALSADLPDKGGKAFTGLAVGHGVHAMWVTGG
jgi:peptide/nickel transport system substrate-binding protein